MAFFFVLTWHGTALRRDAAAPKMATKTRPPYAASCSVLRLQRPRARVESQLPCATLCAGQSNFAGTLQANMPPALATRLPAARVHAAGRSLRASRGVACARAGCAPAAGRPAARGAVLSLLPGLPAQPRAARASARCAAVATTAAGAAAAPAAAGGDAAVAQAGTSAVSLVLLASAALRSIAQLAAALAAGASRLSRSRRALLPRSCAARLPPRRSALARNADALLGFVRPAPRRVHRRVGLCLAAAPLVSPSLGDLMGNSTFCATALAWVLAQTLKARRALSSEG
jgi:hypothetical protein